MWGLVMIIEMLINYFVALLSLVIDGFNVVSIPFDLISSLSTFVSYGSFVVGADLLLIVCSNIVGWLSFKISAGIILFIWRLLPLPGG